MRSENSYLHGYAARVCVHTVAAPAVLAWMAAAAAEALLLVQRGWTHRCHDSHADRADGLHALCAATIDVRARRMVEDFTARAGAYYSPSYARWKGRRALGGACRRLATAEGGLLLLRYHCSSRYAGGRAGRRAARLGTGSWETGQQHVLSCTVEPTDGAWCAWSEPGMQAGRRITLACANRDRDGEVSYTVIPYTALGEWTGGRGRALAMPCQ